APFSRAVACSARKNCWKTKPISRARSCDSSRSLSCAASTPPIRTTPLLGRSSVPSNAGAGPPERPDHGQGVGLARPGGPDDRHQLAPPDGEGQPPESGHRRLLTVDLGHPVKLQDRLAAHDDGTTTRSPTRRSPSTWTRPPSVSNRPSFTATSSRRPSARTSSTANPPPERPKIAVTGTLRAFSTPLVVISTCTGALSSPRAFAGSSRLMEAGFTGA